MDEHDAALSGIGGLCPQCGSEKSIVTDVRKEDEGIYRRRECVQCKSRRSTFEGPLDLWQNGRLLRLFVDQEIAELTRLADRLRALRQRVPQEPPC